MKIFIDGYGAVAHSIVRKLLENHKISSNNLLVNTYNLLENQIFIEFLKEKNVRFVNESYKKIHNEIVEFEPDLLFSLYGRRIIPEVVLRNVRVKSVNLHPSLLPKYKGCFSCPWVILNGETKTGITFHEIVKDVDAGDILFQEEIKLFGDETAYSLYHKLASRFTLRFDDFFEDLIHSRISSQKMPVGGKYYPRKVPYEGYIDPDWSNSQIESFIRAMHFPPYKGAILMHDGKEIEITSYNQFKNIILT